MIGERKGTLHAIACESVRKDWIFLEGLEKQLHNVAQSMKGDPWSSSLCTLASLTRGIIDDDEDKVRLYLSNLKMLWRLGVWMSLTDHLCTKGIPGKRTAVHMMNDQIVATVMAFRGLPERLQVAEFDALWKAAEQQCFPAVYKNNSEKTESDQAKADPKRAN
jgi:hypothetical protein